MLVDYLHERPGSTGCRRAPHQDHVSERIDVIRKPTIARKRQQGVVEAAVTPPHPLLVTGCGRALHRIKCRPKQTNAVLVEALNSSPAGRDLKKKSDLEDFVKIMERRLKDPDAVVAFKADHAARTQVDQRFTNRSPRHSKPHGKLAHRMEASWQKIARGDRVSKYFGNLLLEADLLSNRAEGVEAGLRSGPSPGDFFQCGLIVAQELFLDYPQMLRILPPQPARQEGNLAHDQP